VTQSIFGDYLRTVLLPFVQTVRPELGNPASPAILIFDGYKSHMSEVISAFAAENAITLFLLLPHGSRLLQLLINGFSVVLRFKLDGFLVSGTSQKRHQHASVLSWLFKEHL
jgi:hypothetical protein